MGGTVAGSLCVLFTIGVGLRGMRSPSPICSWPVVGLVLVWSALLVSGFGQMYRYAGRPGPAMAPSPGASRWAVPSRWTVVMAAHGSCPCTRASILALRGILRGHPSQPLVRIVRMDGDTTLPLWQAALAGFDAVEVMADPEAIQLRASGFATSGEVHVLDPSGHLRFHGGVTPARGHGGTCPGLLAVDTALRGGPSTAAPVFGCPLFMPADGSST